jgi:hypothetical protein
MLRANHRRVLRTIGPVPEAVVVGLVMVVLLTFRLVPTGGVGACWDAVVVMAMVKE